jgi:hypothetical protein
MCDKADATRSSSKVFDEEDKSAVRVFLAGAMLAVETWSLSECWHGTSR